MFELTGWDFIVWQLCSFVLIAALVIAVRLLLKKGGNSTANYLIALIVIFSALTIFNNLLAFTGVRDQFPWLLFIPLDFSLYIGPLMYFYFGNKLKHPFMQKKYDVLHLLLPFCVTILYTLNFLKPLQVRADIFNYHTYDVYFTIENALLICSLTLYSFFCHRMLKTNVIEKQWQQPLRSWLTVFLNVVMLLIISEVLFQLLEVLFESNEIDAGSLDYIQLCIDVSLLSWLMIKAYQQYYPEKIFTDYIDEGDWNTTVNSKEVQRIELTNLIRAMEVEKLYQNHDLNLQILSRYLNMSKRGLSQLIKDNFDKSFTTYINDYRLEEIALKLKQGKQKDLTIAALAYDSGFSSRTTFYRYFNEKMGMSPLAFLENSKPSNQVSY